MILCYYYYIVLIGKNGISNGIENVYNFRCFSEVNHLFLSVYDASTTTVDKWRIWNSREGERSNDQTERSARSSSTPSLTSKRRHLIARDYAVNGVRMKHLSLSANSKRRYTQRTSARSARFTRLTHIRGARKCIRAGICINSCCMGGAKSPIFHVACKLSLRRTL